MKYTTNLNLRKPDDSNFASNDDLNYNADVIDQAITDIADIVGNISGVLDAILGEVV